MPVATLAWRAIGQRGSPLAQRQDHRRHGRHVLQKTLFLEDLLHFP